MTSPHTNHIELVSKDNGRSGSIHKKNGMNPDGPGILKFWMVATKLPFVSTFSLKTPNRDFYLGTFQ
jgi:hypothetical protein